MSNLSDDGYLNQKSMSPRDQHTLLAEIDRLTKVCESLRSTLRDEFAGKALTMLKGTFSTYAHEHAAYAYEIADAMLAARDRPKTGNLPNPARDREVTLLHEVRDAAMAVDSSTNYPRLRAALKQLYAECYTAPQEKQP